MLSIHKVSIGPSKTTHFRSGVSAKANSLKVLATIPSVHCRGKKEQESSLCKTALNTESVRTLQMSEFAVQYLMRHWVKLPKELAHGNGLGVYSPINDLLLLPVAVFVHKGENIRQHVQNFGLPSKRLSY